MRVFHSGVVWGVVLCISVQAGEKAADREKAAKESAFEKTAIGTTLESFRQRFPFPNAMKNTDLSKEQMNFVQRNAITVRRPAKRVTSSWTGSCFPC